MNNEEKARWHLQVPWMAVEISPGKWQVCVRYFDKMPNVICTISTRTLPGDETGAFTAQAIVDEHNKSLEG